MRSGGWDGVSDFYEDDEPVESLLASLNQPVDVVTAQPDATPGRVSVTARVHREGRLWVIDVPGYGVTQAERLQDILSMARDYVACIGVIDPGLVDVHRVDVRATAPGPG